MYISKLCCFFFFFFSSCCLPIFSANGSHLWRPKAELIGKTNRKQSMSEVVIQCSNLPYISSHWHRIRLEWRYGAFRSAWTSASSFKTFTVLSNLFWTNFSWMEFLLWIRNHWSQRVYYWCEFVAAVYLWSLGLYRYLHTISIMLFIVTNCFFCAVCSHLWCCSLLFAHPGACVFSVFRCRVRMLHWLSRIFFYVYCSLLSKSCEIIKF